MPLWGPRREIERLRTISRPWLRPQSQEPLTRLRRVPARTPATRCNSVLPADFPARKIIRVPVPPFSLPPKPPLCPHPAMLNACTSGGGYCGEARGRGRSSAEHGGQTATQTRSKTQQKMMAKIALVLTTFAAATASSSPKHIILFVIDDYGFGDASYSMRAALPRACYSWRCCNCSCWA